MADAAVLTVALSPTGALAWPVTGPITSTFGQRDLGWHSGLDIAADMGTLIGASAAGRVSEADWKSDGYGYAVMIDHGNGLETLYGHCSELLVRPGDWVEAGEPVARIGSTGHSTGPHVHLEVRLDGECRDPLDYLAAQI